MENFKRAGVLRKISSLLASIHYQISEQSKSFFHHLVMSNFIHDLIKKVNLSVSPFFPSPCMGL